MDGGDSNVPSLHVASVCASNMNRSMELHNVLARKGFNVKSYGTNSVVRLPGPSADRPNVYDFGTTYSDIQKDLLRKDHQLYTQNGVIGLLDRNIRLKKRPERWQESDEQFDLILSVEERVFNTIVEDLQAKGSVSFKPTHVVNMMVKDTHEDSVVGARFLLQFVQEIVQAGEDWEEEIDDIVEAFQAKCDRPMIHQVLFY